MSAGARFYTVSDASFFPGTVALLNSLRLTGHREDLVVLDNGLTAEQRRRLQPHAEVVDIPQGVELNAYTLKPFPYLLEPKGTVAIIDSDMIVTGSLAPILAEAANGRICLIAEQLGCQVRCLAAWEQLFALSAPPRPQPYANAGFVVLATDQWPALLGRWWDACLRIPPDAQFSDDDHPGCYGDQDALNALLMSEVDAGSVTVLPEWREIYATDSLDGVELADERRLTCLNKGREILILHHDQRPKAWASNGRVRMHRGDPYVRLLPRVLLQSDVQLRLEPEELPWWLRGRFRDRLAVSAEASVERVRARAALGTRLANRGRLPQR